MKREDLAKLGLAEDVIDKIMALHGADIEGHKGKVSTAQAEVDALKKQIAEANTTIEGFKKLDPEALQKAVDEWKAKAEAAQKDAEAQITQLRFEHALEGALTGAKAKSPKAVRALLNTDQLKLADDGSILGLKEQLEKIQSEADYLFESDQPTPKIVTGGTPKNTAGADPMIQAARKAAGLPVEGAK